MAQDLSKSRAAAKLCAPASSKANSGPMEGEAADEELAVLARALGHPARVKIVRMLARSHRCTCGGIVDQFALAQSTVSQHFNSLKDAGLICATIDGQRIWYGVDESVLRRLRALVAVI